MHRRTQERERRKAQAALYPDAQIVEGAIRELEADLEPEPHWIDDPATRKAFFAWTRDQGLSQGDVYGALQVESVHSFAGSKADAKHVIEQYVKDMSEPEEQPAPEYDDDDPGRPF